MKRRNLILLFMLFIMMVGGMLSITFFIRRGTIANEEDERTADERTTEEYIAVLIDNKEDFDYVADIMKQWSRGYIFLAESDLNNQEEVVIADHFTTNSQEMASEMLNNIDFLNHLQNLYNLGEINGVFCTRSSDGYIVVFTFNEFPKDFHGGLYYMENLMTGYGIYQIDEMWTLWMTPNI